jgi:hypothetical protein
MASIRTAVSNLLRGVSVMLGSGASVGPTQVRRRWPPRNKRIVWGFNGYLFRRLHSLPR